MQPTGLTGAQEERFAYSVNNLDLICEQLERQAYGIAPDFVSAELVAGLNADIAELQQSGKLRRAGIGHGEAHTLRDDIRSDEIYWFADQETQPHRQKLLAEIEKLKLALNRNLFLNLATFEGHYAVYNSGTHYQKHVDAFKDDDARTVSLILYLNPPGWKKEDGGLLKLYPQNANPIEVLPEGGTLVCFLSREIEHEVTSTQRTRKSFAGWLKQRR